MSSSDLFRWGGLAAMGGGALFILGDLLGLIIDSDGLSIAATSAYFVIQHLLYLFGAVLLVGGLVGLYVRQAEVAGALGLIGFVSALLGTVLSIGAFWSQAYIMPALARLVPAILEILRTDPPWGFIQATVVFALGWSLFGIASLRVQLYPRAANVLLIVGAAITLLPFVPIRAVFFGAGIVWLGFVLFIGRGEEA